MVLFRRISLKISNHRLMSVNLTKTVVKSWTLSQNASILIVNYRENEIEKRIGD